MPVEVFNGTTLGVSPTVALEPPGENCSTGGVRIDSFFDVFYACNGTTGPQGPAGNDGVSPTVMQELPGGNCVNGGVAINDASGVTRYVCNGTPGQGGGIGSTYVVVGPPACLHIGSHGICSFIDGVTGSTSVANCDPGDKVIGGGFENFNGGFLNVIASKPVGGIGNADPTGWLLGVGSNPLDTSLPSVGVPYALCANTVP